MLSVRLAVSTVLEPTQLLAAILRNSWHLPFLPIRYITGHGPLTFLSMCVCVSVYVCVWDELLWACPLDILLDANGIHRHGSWRGGGYGCLCINGDCHSPVGVCTCILVNRGRLLWHISSVGWCHRNVCVCVCEMWCLLTGACVFALCLCLYRRICRCARACVCVRVGSQWSSVLVCVSGGQGDKGVCFFLIRTPTSTSLSLHCSTSLLSILLPFPLYLKL